MIQIISTWTWQTYNNPRQYYHHHVIFGITITTTITITIISPAVGLYMTIKLSHHHNYHYHPSSASPHLHFHQCPSHSHHFYLPHHHGTITYLFATAAIHQVTVTVLPWPTTNTSDANTSLSSSESSRQPQPMAHTLARSEYKHSKTQRPSPITTLTPAYVPFSLFFLPTSLSYNPPRNMSPFLPPPSLPRLYFASYFDFHFEVSTLPSPPTKAKPHWLLVNEKPASTSE